MSKLKFPSFAIAALIATVLILTLAFKNHHTDGFRNSDYLWTIAFFDDLAKGGTLSDWNLSNHTDFFPDKVLSWGLWEIVGHNFDLFLVIYGSIGFMLWALTVRVLFGSFTLGLLSSTLALVLIYFGRMNEAFLTPYLPSLHFSATCLGFILTYTVLEIRFSKTVKASALVLLMAIFLSDRLVVIYCGAYAASLIGVSYFLKKDFKRFLKSGLVLLLGTLTVLALHDTFWNSFTNVTLMPSTSTADLLWMHATAKRTRLVLAIALVLSAIVYQFKIFPKIKTRELFAPAAVAFVAAILCVLGVMIKAPLETRYLVPSAFLMLTACLSLIEVKRTALRWVTTFAIAGSLVLFLKSKPLDGLIYKIEKSSVRSCLDDLATRHELKSGVGTYWNTHEVNMLSAQTSPVRAFNSQLSPYFWVTSKRFFTESFNFIVEKDRAYSIDMGFVQGKIGPEFAEVLNCEKAETKIYVLSPAQEAELAKILNPSL